MIFSWRVDFLWLEINCIHYKSLNIVCLTKLNNNNNFRKIIITFSQSQNITYMYMCLVSRSQPLPVQVMGGSGGMAIHIQTHTKNPWPRTTAVWPFHQTPTLEGLATWDYHVPDPWVPILGILKLLLSYNIPQMPSHWHRLRWQWSSVLLLYHFFW